MMRIQTPSSARRYWKENWILHAFLLPGMLYLLIFRYIPMGGNVIAFKDYNIIKGIWASPWVGLKHFYYLWESRDFWRVMSNSLSISFMSLIFGMPAPILLALMLNEMRSLRYKRMMQTIIYLPHFISWVILVGMLQNFLSPSTGILNSLRESLGLEKVAYLANKHTIRPVLILSQIWKGAGWGTIVYMAAMSGIDTELYEAAMIDGASRLQRIWHITLPGISSTIVVVLIMNTGSILSNNFEQIYLLQNSMTIEVMKETDVRNRMNSNFLFGDQGLLTCYPEALRGDILALLDDAWDVPFDTPHNEENCNLFGSMIVNDEKFPEYAHLAPYDRLRALVARIKAMGFAGVGLWVPSNHFGENRSEPREKILNQARAFWADRAKMCAYADVAYVKVDWGYHRRDVEYRALMTDAFKRYAPNVRIEHVIGIFHMPYDPSPKEQTSKAFTDFMHLAYKTIPLCDVYRTYDTTLELSVSTTLMRIAKLVEIQAEPDERYAGVIGIEDNATVAAALGMATGMFRHIDQPHFLEIKRCLMWQRIAPPVRFRWADFTCDEELLCDSYHYHKNPEEWPWIGNQVIEQYAPARIAVNAPLAKVESVETNHAVPFLLTSLNAQTGAYTIAAIERVIMGKKYVPLAHVCAQSVPTDAAIGIFGSFQTLTLSCSSDITGKRVLMQSLADDEAQDITDAVQFNGNKMIIPGQVIERIGAKENEACLNGVVLRFL